MVMLKETDVKWCRWVNGTVCGHTYMADKPVKIYLPYVCGGYTAWVPSKEYHYNHRIMSKKYRKLGEAKRVALQTMNAELARDAARKESRRRKPPLTNRILRGLEVMAYHAGRQMDDDLSHHGKKQRHEWKDAASWVLKTIAWKSQK